MATRNALKLFESKNVRTVWDDQQQKWYISIVDVIEVLTESVDSAAYWRKLKQRLKEEGNETVTNCHGLKMIAPDGKMRLTDVADIEQLFRLIQSIPSPKAMAFKVFEFVQVSLAQMQCYYDFSILQVVLAELLYFHRIMLITCVKQCLLTVEKHLKRTINV